MNLFRQYGTTAHCTSGKRRKCHSNLRFDRYRHLSIPLPEDTACEEFKVRLLNMSNALHTSFVLAAAAWLLIPASVNRNQ